MRTNDFKNISGILVIDKPQGLTSMDVVEEIKRVLRVKKAGHGGTLDPIATGVLPIFLNAATKVAQIFLDGDKLYEGVMQLGITTDTYDITGEVLATSDPSSITLEDVQRIIPHFIGEIQQSPPPFSAAKYKGRPLYRYARNGLIITKNPKTVRIYDFRTLEMNGAEIRFLLACSKGTYVRSLVHEFGQRLGCGAVLKSLVRLKKSVFTLDQAISLDEVKGIAKEDRISLQKRIIPLEKALEFLPKVIVNEEFAQKIRAGIRIPTSSFLSWVRFQKLSLNPTEKYIRLATPKNELVAIIENPFMHPTNPYLTYFRVFPVRNKS